MDERSVDVLEIIELSGPEVSLYRALRPLSGRTVSEVASSLGVTQNRFVALAARLISAGVLSLDDGVATIPSPGQLFADVLAVEAGHLLGVVERLDRMRVAIPTARGLLDGPESDHGLSGLDIRVGEELRGLVLSWVRGSTGDLMWVRPDQWSLPREPETTRVVLGALERGQRSRAIYPARVLQEAPACLFERMEAGEEVRLIAEVPGRMAVIEGVGAFVPEHWGETNGRHIVIQHPGVSAVLEELFEELWARAVVVPGSRPTDLDRRLLLEQLSRGAKDEQMARTLGLSLRTVRRRVATLLIDLDVETRFQAGVEAVRRGWI